MPSTISSTMHYISERAKAHNKSVQAAYELYYGAGDRLIQEHTALQQRSASTASATETPRQNSTASTSSKKSSKWAAIKKAAKAHNRASNEAYLTYYGVASFHS